MRRRRRLAVNPISIHALREEGDSCASTKYWPLQKFLSTPSARRATNTVVSLGDINADFYPRPPRGGRQSIMMRAEQIWKISIHALREEGDRHTST